MDHVGYIVGPRCNATSHPRPRSLRPTKPRPYRQSKPAKLRHALFKNEAGSDILNIT